MNHRSRLRLGVASTALLSLALAGCSSAGNSSPSSSAPAPTSSAAAPTSSAAPATDAPSSATSEPASSSAAPTGEKVTISMLVHWAPDSVELLKKAATAYSAKNPNVTVEVRAVPFGDLLTTIQSQGKSPTGPTIMNIYDLWLPQLVGDQLLAKAPEANVADLKANYTEGLVADASVDGTPYGYPNEVTLYALNYNKKLFAEAGIAGPPKTWDELKAAAQKLTKKNGDTVTQQGFGMISSWAAGVVHPFASLLASNGGKLITDGKATLDSEQAKQAFELIDTLANKDKSSSVAMSTADANTAGPYMDSFVGGKTGMIIMANWWQGALKKAMGDKYSDVATAPIPVGPSGDGSHAISYSWHTTVSGNATPEQQAAAWDFLKFLNSADSGTNGASAMSGILLGMGSLPSRTSDLKANESTLSADPFLKTYADAVATATPFPVTLGGQEFTEVLQKQLESLQAGKASAADVQAQAQKDGQSVLEEANG